MGAQGKFPARRLKSPSMAGAWFGLAAIALHVFAPFMGLAFYIAISAARTSANNHAHPPHHDVAGANTHHTHAGNPSAEPAPLNPDLLCIGDCPCCSLSERPAAVIMRSVLVLLPPLHVIDSAVERAPAPHVFHAGTHRLSRAPPLFT